jgi:hypothetical protein
MFTSLSGQRWGSLTDTQTARTHTLHSLTHTHNHTHTHTHSRSHTLTLTHALTHALVRARALPADLIESSHTISQQEVDQ